MLSTVPIVVPYAAILGLLAAALTLNVILNRVRTGVIAGDGGVAEVSQALRAHGNFVEQAPIALMLIALAEILGANAIVIHALCIGLLIARLASAWTLNRTLALTAARQMSGGLSIVILVAASATILLPLAGIK
jgi:uncharacterized protein